MFIINAILCFQCFAVFGVYLGASKPITKPPKTNEMLLLFIRIIGCFDILLLSSYLAVCIFDRPGQEKTDDFVPLSLHLPQHSAVYEILRLIYFLLQGVTQHLSYYNELLKLHFFKNQTFRIFDFIKVCCVEYSQKITSIKNKYVYSEVRVNKIRSENTFSQRFYNFLT